MTNELVKFDFEKYPVRVFMIDGEPWFVAKDVCNVLGLINVADALLKLDEDEKGVGLTDTLGGNQELSYVSESGVYYLAIRSRKSEAKKFKRWVTHEVLPAIRRTGRYAIGEIQLPRSYPEALRALANEVEKSTVLEAKVAEDQPKVDAYDVVLNTAGLCLVGSYAKKHNVGVRWLYDWLKEQNVLYYNGRGNLIPYAGFVRFGWFALKETIRHDGSRTDDTAYLTHKGELWLTSKLTRAGFPVQKELPMLKFQN